MTVRRNNHGVRNAPRVSATAFPRPRLLERLDTWRDITVVHGPIGAGKTILLASWVASLTSPVLWCEPVAGRLPFTDIDVFTAEGAGVLVIDHGERIDATQFKRLGQLIDRTPTLRVVVATRSTRTIREIEAASDTALDVITPTDLLVTLEELQAADLFEDDTARDELLARSEGLAIAVREGADAALQGTSGTRERLRRLLRAELGRHQGRYEAVLRIALLPRVDRLIVRAWGLSEQLLDDLEDAGFVTWDEDWLRMHPFIRGVLHDDATQHLEVAERQHLIAAAIRASLIRRDPLVALREAFEIRDLALATEVTFANMVDLLEARDETYEIFTGIRTSQLRGYPGLVVMLVLLSNMDPATRPRALQLLATESLFQRVQPNRSLHRERVVYRAFEAAALRLTPFSGGALPLIRRAVDEFSTLSDNDQEALGRMGPMLQTHLGIGAFYAGDPELANQCFALADATHLEAGRADRVDPLSMRAGLAALSGEIPLARRLLAEADAMEWPAGWRTSSPADFFNLGMAVLALEDGDTLAADSHLAAAGPIGDILEHWELYALIRARRDHLAGEIDVGLMRLRNIREHRRSDPSTNMAQSLLDAAEAELRLAAGEPDVARSIASKAAKHSAVGRLTLARTKLALDRPSAAATRAQRVLHAPKTAPRERFEAELVLACSALRMGYLHDAEPVAKRIAELIETTGIRASLRTVASRDRDALTEVLLRVGVEESIVALVAVEAIPIRPDARPATALTPREHVVLELLAETGALDEIAARLFVSRNTVKSQLRAIYQKLGVSSRAEALTRAAVLGLLTRHVP